MDQRRVEGSPGSPAADDPFMPPLPTTWDDSTFDLWSDIARLRHLQRRVAERITAEADAVRAAVERHPTCSGELDRLRLSVGQLVEVTARLLAIAREPRST